MTLVIPATHGSRPHAYLTMAALARAISLVRVLVFDPDKKESREQEAVFPRNRRCNICDCNSPDCGTRSPLRRLIIRRVQIAWLSFIKIKVDTT